MNNQTLHALRWLPGVAAVLLATSAWAAPASADKATRDAFESRYRSERAACLDGSSQQERAACLQEAGAARAEARQGRLGNGETEPALDANAVQRCKAVAPADRNACLRIARGEGSKSGSAAAGGVLKRLVTRTVGAASAPKGQ